ncbi:MAG: caspase domain-containing protein, partial [Phormidium sp.]
MKRALVVGINRYLKLGRLHTPANDANAVAQRLHDIGFEDIRGLPATDEAGLWVSSDPDKRVSKYELEKAIDWLFAINEKSHIPETALFYFAGHGRRSVKVHRSKGFLATSTANPEKPPETWGVSLVDVRQILEHSPIKEQIVILDCCHGGEVFNYKEVDPGNSDIVTRCLMSACGENQAAFEPKQGQGNHSYFTSTLLDGLQQPGRVTTETLWVYVQENFKYKLQQVRRNNLNNPDSYQDPKCDNRDGAIVLIEPEIDPESESIISNPNFNPYKGLEAFQEADAPYFFGRRKLTRTFVNKIYDQPFLAVAGSSGSGKSSLVRAGLIPELKQGTTLSETADWQIHDPFKPGDDPLASLAQVFVNENNEHLSLEQVNAALAQGATGVKRLMAHIKSPTVLLVIDQFEQLFSQRPSEEKRRQFLDCLCGAIDSDSPRNQGDGRDSSLRVVITIRDDFLGKCAEYPQLLKLINQNKQIVGPMNEGELRNAISQPTKKLGWEIPRDLETEMVKDVQNSPGSLPLLQYVLQQMVERRHNHGQKVTVKTYQEIGGVQKALQNRANKVYYQTLSSEQQAITRSIFLKLTQLLENSKPIARQVRKSELTDLPYPPEEVETVLEKLEAARLIVTSELEARGNPEEKITVVDVAHESLISNWKQLERWVEENFEAKRQEEDIQAKARDWEDKGKRREGLLRGLDLAEVELFEREHSQTFPLSPLAREFVRKSIRQRRNSRLLGIGAVVTVFSVVTGLWLNAQRQATIA